MDASPTPTTTLPSEIQALIISFAGHAALAKLCLLSKDYNKHVTPLLYRNLVITRANVDRLFLGLRRTAKEKLRPENRTSKAEYIAKLEEIKRVHGAAFAAFEAGGGDIHDPDSRDPYPRYAESDPETDDEEATRSDPKTDDTEAANEQSGEDVEGAWERRRALFRHTRTITFVQVPREAFVTDLQDALSITRGRYLEEDYQAHSTCPTDCSGRSDYEGDDEDDDEDEVDAEDEDEVEGEEDGGARELSQGSAHSGADEDDGSLFPALKHICFSSRVAAYLNNYLPRDFEGRSSTDWHRGLYLEGDYYCNRVTLPAFVYVVRSPAFAQPESACFALPPPPTDEDFATYAARWTLHTIGPAPVRFATEYGRSRDWRLPPRETEVEMPVAEAIDYFGRHMRGTYDNVRLDPAAAIGHCISAPKVTMHSVPFGPTLHAHNGPRCHDVHHGVQCCPRYGASCHGEWERDVGVDEERTLFLREPQTLLEDTRELAPRNRVIGLPSAQQEGLKELVLERIGTTRPADVLPPSEEEHAAVAAAKEEAEAAKTAPFVPWAVPGLFYGMPDGHPRGEAIKSVTRDYVALAEQKGPHVRSKLDPFMDGDTLDVCKYFAENYRLQGDLEIELSRLGLPRLLDSIFSHQQVKDALADAKSRHFAHRADSHQRWNDLSAELDRKIAIAAAPTIEERLQFLTYDEADPCEVCGEKGAQERSLRDLITWARGIRH
jgi:hypothetical protein